MYVLAAAGKVRIYADVECSFRNEKGPALRPAPSLLQMNVPPTHEWVR
jgi:hypothetical protein